MSEVSAARVSTQDVRLRDVEGTLFIEIVPPEDGGPLEIRYGGDAVVELGEGRPLESIAAQTDEIDSLARLETEALERGESLRSACISRLRRGLMWFHLERDLDPASDDWERRKAADALEAAGACTAPPPDPPHPPDDPSTPEGGLMELCKMDPTVCGSIDMLK